MKYPRNWKPRKVNNRDPERPDHSIVDRAAKLTLRGTFISVNHDAIMAMVIRGILVHGDG
jgi:hypothetical protein